MTTPIPPDEPGDIDRAIAEIEAHLEEMDAEDDGRTARVRDLEAYVAEADRIRDLPTERVLEREAALAEERALAALERTAHTARLRDSGERERTELRAKAESAAARAALERDTNVQALRLSRRSRSRVGMLWAVLVLAMAFTAVGVQSFAAAGAPAWSPRWVVAWGVDPLLSGLVVALLLTRGDLAAFAKPADESAWDRRVVPLIEIGALLAALLMNISPEIQARAAWESITLHVIVPLAAVAAALALPVVARRYAEAIASLYDRPTTPGTETLTRPLTPPEYRANTAPDGSSGEGVTGPLVARARALIAAGDLPVDPSARRLRDALRCGMDSARIVRDALKGGA